MMQRYLNLVKPIINSYGEVFFLNSKVAAFILMLITLFNPNVGISGIISVVSAYLFARLLNMELTFLKSGFYTYNALLVGLSLGYIFQINFLSAFFIILAGIFTLLISIALSNIFYKFFGLPILSIPFVLVSSIAYLASYNYSNLYVTSLYQATSIDIFNMPPIIEGYFIAVGAIMFSPKPLFGMIIAIILCFCSRIIFFLSLMGFYVGTTLAIVMHSDSTAVYYNVNNFNYVLIAIAIGGVFLIPSVKSYLLAATAVLVSSILLNACSIFWARFGIPMFTLPFNIIALVFLYALRTVELNLVTINIRKTPEDTLDDYLTNIFRFNNKEPRLSLPFSGQWLVWQGFHGQWTHKGAWAYAYDFVIQRDGKNYKTTGEAAEDFYAFNKPVLSPCRGRVIEVMNNIPDNKPGTTDLLNNWGNYIIIETDNGLFVELSHFAQGSIIVQAGNWVEHGTKLGLCGNSGNSPEPHIHVQVQESSKLGAKTMPFTFEGYVADGMIHHTGTPDEGITISPIFHDSIQEFKTSYAIDKSLIFEINDLTDNFISTEVITVKMSPNSEFYLVATDGSKLFFNSDKNFFYFYHLEGNNILLKTLFKAAPKIPLYYQENIIWHDYIPLYTSNIKYFSMINFIRSFNHEFAKTRYQGQWRDNLNIKATVSENNKSEIIYVVVNKQSGISEIKMENMNIKLLEAK